jgi:hypothetical protein
MLISGNPGRGRAAITVRVVLYTNPRIPTESENERTVNCPEGGLNMKSAILFSKV